MHKNAIKLENSGVRGHFTTKMGPKTGDLNNRKPNRLIEKKPRLLPFQKPTPVMPSDH